ncbi:MAG: HIRAN domain-containing protein [Methylococcaceae bacterium]
MSTQNYHLGDKEIPEDLQIFEERLEVAGVNFRKEDASAFATAKNGWLELERELGNKHDPNAIKVIGCNKGFFGIKRRFIGYVPKEVSRLIVEGRYLNQIRPRLLRTYKGDLGFVEILFQILGPKGKKYEFRQTSSAKGDHYTDFVDRVDQLIQEKNFEDAIQLLYTLVDATEKEAKKTGEGVAPWYYEKLAVIYRKQKRYGDEVAILERFDGQPKSQGALAKKLAERLLKARQLSS